MVAVPELLMLTVPRLVVPSMKVTVPLVGTPAAEVTNAERVTCWPKAEGLGVPVTEVVLVTGAETSNAVEKLLDIELTGPAFKSFRIAAVVGTARSSSVSRVRAGPGIVPKPCRALFGSRFDCD